jgi:L,D-peptidoglycan transpeptidase YkuD (ErfK/YbiS/YcfS/YnhG family)
LFSCVAISDANFQQILEDCRRSEEDQVLQREWE